MWSWLSRSDDLIKIVRETDSFKELLSLKKHLSDSKNTELLRDSHVYDALSEITSKVKNSPFAEILDFLF